MVRLVKVDEKVIIGRLTDIDGTLYDVDEI